MGSQCARLASECLETRGRFDAEARERSSGFWCESGRRRRSWYRVCMKSEPLTIAARLSNNELLAQVKHLARHEREATASLVAHLAELDERRRLLVALCILHRTSVFLGVCRLRPDPSGPSGPSVPGRSRVAFFGRRQSDDPGAACSTPHEREPPAASRGRSTEEQTASRRGGGARAATAGGPCFDPEAEAVCCSCAGRGATHGPPDAGCRAACNAASHAKCSSAGTAA
jgi:hypothetical protein